METIDEIGKTLNEFADLQVLCEAQTQTIFQLTKKNQKLEEEVHHLKKLLDDTVPGTSLSPKALNDSLSEMKESPAVSLCEIEIYRLQQKTMDGPLTFEEVKKLEIFVKTLKLLKPSKEESKPKVKDLTEEDLLDIVEIQQ